LLFEKGYGLATSYYGDIDPDFDEGFRNGIHSLLDTAKDNYRDRLSSISAWAFGLSAAMDYFETDKNIDEKQIILVGHSRLGKTVLWAGVKDERFAAVISNNSGCGGAALFRRQYGETIESINSSFPHWFTKEFHGFGNKEEKLPVDQHMLIALIAPRPVYIASAEEDKWADPRGEFLALINSGPVYSLYGYEIIDQDHLPEINKAVIEGKMGYHIRSGKHDITEFDWSNFLLFMDYQYNNQNK
jgi:hypothetical protein